MLDVDFVRQKLRAVLGQIRQLKSADFPYRESSSALALLTEIYERDLKRLDGLDPSVSVDVRQSVCAHANTNITRYYHILGFILRSTNVRNAFEIYDPLLRICRAVYGDSAKLIISSEWDFSPFTYPAVTADLPDLMFIGLPSTEAGNSLLVPLAGHELGHSVWRKAAAGRSPALSNLDKELQQALTKSYEDNWPEFENTFGIAPGAKGKLLSDLFLRNIWTQSYRLASRQTEELFCDLFGLRLFGEGFIYSFIYLIAPNLGDRAPYYPSLASRIKALLHGSNDFQVEAPANLATYFSDPAKQLSKPEAFILKMADASSEAMVTKLISAIGTLVTDCGLVLSTNQERSRILKHFQALCPPSEVKTMADIINAGWQLRLDWSPWEQFGFDPSNRNEVLNDLVFKTMEVMEFESKVFRKQSC